MTIVVSPKLSIFGDLLFHSFICRQYMLIKCLRVHAHVLHFCKFCIYDIKTEMKCYYIHYSVLWKGGGGGGGGRYSTTRRLQIPFYSASWILCHRIYFLAPEFCADLRFTSNIFFYISIELAHGVLLCLPIKHLNVYYSLSQFRVIFCDFSSMTFIYW